MLTMQQHATMNHGPLGMNIKSAMAANMGSSLFLFQGLHRISPYLLSTAAEASSPTSSSSKSSSPSPSYFRFELQCTSCRRGECPICLDYNSKIRIGYSSVSPAATTNSSSSSKRRKTMTKKQAVSSSDGVQILRLDLCSYSRKVTLTREIVSRWIGLSYTEGDAAGSKPKEVDFDSLMRELDSQGAGYSLVSKDEMEDGMYNQEENDGGRSSSFSWESRTQRLSGSYQRRDYGHVQAHSHAHGHGRGHARYGSSSSSGYYRL